MGKVLRKQQKKLNARISDYRSNPPRSKNHAQDHSGKRIPGSMRSL